MFQIPEQDGLQKLLTVLQTILFLAMIILPYLLLRRVVHRLFLRILCLILLYIIASFVTYCVLRPLFLRIEAAWRKRKQKEKSR